jgi:hypothetical protein
MERPCLGLRHPIDQHLAWWSVGAPVEGLASARPMEWSWGVLAGLGASYRPVFGQVVCSEHSCVVVLTLRS